MLAFKLIRTVIIAMTSCALINRNDYSIRRCKISRSVSIRYWDSTQLCQFKNIFIVFIFSRCLSVQIIGTEAIIPGCIKRILVKGQTNTKDDSYIYCVPELSKEVAPGTSRPSLPHALSLTKFHSNIF